ncbi:hypothetical protein B0H12DRAFT_1133230 [Mycena haematopus]|nr:hypothetical protein B0H12DRAFT_1133230 [Mycena haematopus]
MVAHALICGLSLLESRQTRGVSRTARKHLYQHRGCKGRLNIYMESVRQRDVASALRSARFISRSQRQYTCICSKVLSM